MALDFGGTIVEREEPKRVEPAGPDFGGTVVQDKNPETFKPLDTSVHQVSTGSQERDTEINAVKTFQDFASNPAFENVPAETIKQAWREVKQFGQLNSASGPAIFPEDLTGVTSLPQYFESFDADIDYVTGAPNELRSLVAQADTLEEKRRAINTFLGAKAGEDFATQDSHNRLVMIDPKSGAKIALDETEATLRDLTDLRGEVPALAGALIAAYATSGSSVMRQLLFDLLGTTAGFTAGETFEELAGRNLETIEEVSARGMKEAAFSGTAFVLGKGLGVIANRSWSPWQGNITPDDLKLYEDMLSFNAEREARGLAHSNLRTSAFNSSPFLGRVEGILSKLPFSGAIFKRERVALDVALQNEAEFLAKGLPDAVRSAEVIKSKLAEAVSAKRRAMYDANNARWTGVDPVTGGQVAQDGAGAALNLWKEGMDQQASGVASLAGAESFIDSKPIKDAVRQILTEAGRVPIPEARRKTLQKFLELPEELTFSEAQFIRRDLGEQIGGRDPISNLQEGQAKFLYNKMTGSMERSIPREIADGETLSRFSKEFKQFNKDYAKGHDLFNNKKSPIRKLITEFSTDGLVHTFVRKGNVGNIRLIRDTLDKDSWEAFQGAAQEVILDSKTGKGMLKKLDGLGNDMQMELFGFKRASSLRRLAGSIDELERTPLTKFLNQAKSGEALLRNFIKPQSTQSAIIARKLLGKDSQDWANIQIGLVSDLLRKGTKKGGHLDGEALQDAMSSFNPGVLKEILGSSKVETLRRLANIARGGKKVEGGAAGGLAAGFFIIDMMRGNLHLGVNAASYVASKMLLSDFAKAWVTNIPISKLGKTHIRALTRTLATINAEHSQSVPFEAEEPPIAVAQ